MNAPPPPLAGGRDGGDGDDRDAPPLQPPCCPLCDPKSSHLRLAYNLKEASPVFKGRISTVYRATCSACGLPAAIKAYLPPGALAPRHLLNLRREVESMKRLAAVGAPHAQALVGQFEEEVEEGDEGGGMEGGRGGGGEERASRRRTGRVGGLRLVTRWAEGGDCYAALGRAASAASAAAARAAAEASERPSSSASGSSSSGGSSSSDDERDVRRKIAAKTPLTFSSSSSSSSVASHAKERNNPFRKQDYGDLQKHKSSQDRPPTAAAGGLPEHSAREICASVLRCLAAAHAQGIVHRDVKPENVLLSGEGAAAVASAAEAAAAERFSGRSSPSSLSCPRRRDGDRRLLPRDVTLADWGLAIDAHREPPRSRVGTLDYSAPELLRAGVGGAGVAGGGLSARSTATQPTKPPSSSSTSSLPSPPLPPPYTSAVDVWAVGVLAFELLSGSAPFAPVAKQEEQQQQNSKPSAAAAASAASAAAAETEARVLAGERPDVSRLPDTAVRSFVLSATAFDASERPSAFALLSHPWILEGEAAGKKPLSPGATTFSILAHAPSSVPAWTIGAATATTAAAEAARGAGVDVDVDVVENDGDEREQLERAETVLPRDMSVS